MISLVIPIYNEELLIEKLFYRCTQALSTITEDFEIICVDDGSQDRSLEILKSFHKKDTRFKVLVLSRNFGHQAAYTAGLQHAKGEYIAMMDGDLQDPPELLASMHQKLLSEQLDIVHGKRQKRKEQWGKKALIKLFHFVFKRFSQISDVNDVGNFSIMNRKALNAFLSLTEKNRYLPGLRFFIGFTQGFVYYDREDRQDGEAKMSTLKLINLALDAIFSFSDLPIKICLYTGLIGMILFFFAGLYTLISKIIGIAIIGWSSILLSLYFLGSIQLLFMGILGEYVFRIYKETQQRPIFIVKEFYSEERNYNN
ncbi:glycosyltransferase family 2 protein [Xanthocytophaga agilis]|uniref:Glycosyltransferase family 2 protein n=1 Tax=Xanthocytophaga agilis TaxID=3048010 RepID=A0AAE3R8T4_9BACT|nr:glycosyltransferase family 2 protein [Xanthocytophaga agilis]MDJ1503682.1 glycosyltransferase family 2 protein [Xanthocytophaga agilis]